MSMLKHAALLTQSSNTRPDSRMLVRATEPTPRSASFTPPRLSLAMVVSERLLQGLRATSAIYFPLCAPSRLALAHRASGFFAGLSKGRRLN